MSHNPLIFSVYDDDVILYKMLSETVSQIFVVVLVLRCMESILYTYAGVVFISDLNQRVCLVVIMIIV